MALTYKDAGVDIAAGDELVRRIGKLVKSTHRPEVLSDLGGFSGLCSLPTRYRDPVLVSGTDGVGTKLKTAFATGRHDTVGIDLVAMAVNDVITIGAEPLLFLDYFATGRLEVGVAEAVVSGIADGCRQAGCALIGGETAEMPGMYQDGEYDLAGFCVGVVERDRVGAHTPRAGDALIGLASSGLHSNGHSLARRALLTELGLGLDDAPEALAGGTVADALLEPTKIYAAALAAIERAGVTFAAAAHITGGGLSENLPRVINGGLAAKLDESTWTEPPIFALVASAGVERAEMRRTFNLGVGMVVCVRAQQADSAIAAAREAGETAAVIGQVIADDSGESAVVYS